MRDEVRGRQMGLLRSSQYPLPSLSSLSLRPPSANGSAVARTELALFLSVAPKS